MGVQLYVFDRALTNKILRLLKWFVCSQRGFAQMSLDSKKRANLWQKFSQR
jgi:hypothetical protein